MACPPLGSSPPTTIEIKERMCIYFIKTTSPFHSPDTAWDSLYIAWDSLYINIGYCRRPADIGKKLKALQAGNPHEIKVLGVMEGGISIERALHERFKLLRGRGKWFLNNTGDEDFEVILEEAHKIWLMYNTPARRLPTNDVKRLSQQLRNTIIEASQP